VRGDVTVAPGLHRKGAPVKQGAWGGDVKEQGADTGAVQVRSGGPGGSWWRVGLGQLDPAALDLEVADFFEHKAKLGGREGAAGEGG